MAREDGDDRLDLFLGTYSSGGGNGLVPLAYRPAEEAWSIGPSVSDIQNASFGAYSSKHGVHYLVDERADGCIGAYLRTGDGVWTCLSVARTGGEGPCYVSLNPRNTALAVANYDSGSVALYRLDPGTGAVIDPPIIRQNSGRGAHPERQQAPHAHCAVFDRDWLYCVDLGTDQILAFPFGEEAHRLAEPFTAFAFPAGEGPRHMLVHPKFRRTYALTELGNRMFVLATRGDGRLDELQQLSTLPGSFKGHSTAAHLALNAAGDRLYASNRGHNSIAVFAVADDGRLSLMQIASTHGDSPRFFLLLEAHRRLIVAHQKSNSVVVLQLEDDGAVGERLATLAAPQPVFVGLAG